MIRWIIMASFFISCLGEDETTMEKDHITINTRTGLLSLGSRPNYVRPGDIILVCIPPGVGEACSFFMEAKNLCMVTDRQCHVVDIPKHLPQLASFLFLHADEHTFHPNVMQPTSHPLVHCLIMAHGNVATLERCVTALSSNTTQSLVEEKEMLDTSVHETKPGMVHFVVDGRAGQSTGDFLTFFFLILISFVPIGLFYIHAGLLTTKEPEIPNLLWKR